MTQLHSRLRSTRTRTRIPGLVNPNFLPGVMVNSTITTGVGDDLGTEFSWSHTVNSANNRYMILGLTIRGYASLVSAAYNGVPLSFIQRSAESVDNVGASELWGLVNPDVGTHTLEFVLDSSDFWEVGVIDFKNVNQTTPIGTPTTNTYGTSATPAVLVSGEPKDLVIGVVSREGFSCSNDVGTERWHLTCDGNWSGDALTYPVTEASSYISWTLGVSATWSISAVAIKNVSNG